MAEICYRRHRFPPVIIQHAIWLYLRFTLSYRDVEELLAERGLDISIAQREAQIEPDRMLDDYRRKAVAAVGDIRHRLSLPTVALPSPQLS